MVCVCVVCVLCVCVCVCVCVYVCVCVCVYVCVCVLEVPGIHLQLTFPFIHHNDFLSNSSFFFPVCKSLLPMYLKGLFKAQRRFRHDSAMFDVH